jgi:AraC family transcriptional regulator of adaptative response/methylated-DNA-[protein]-cysteine methyltransferase
MVSRDKTVPQLIYGHHSSPFGACIVGVVKGRLACLEFTSGREVALAKIQSCARTQGWRAVWAEKETAPLAEWIFDASGEALRKLPLELPGTTFQRGVWQALREIPYGRTLSYGDLARRVGQPGASRAVGAAVGANRIAYVVPCHRVLRKDGGLGGFRWGLRLKRSLLYAEAVTRR